MPTFNITTLGCQMNQADSLKLAAGLEKLGWQSVEKDESADLFVINKVDLAPMVGANLDIMERDTLKMRGKKPFIFSNLKKGQGLKEISNFIISNAGI